ncbi:MAG: transporter substrate-binding domain-containing protein [Campylobacterales bacterium]|nr:transporter substrate-binding domain-containing protein [Campylobacterales bacterium]
MARWLMVVMLLCKYTFAQNKVLHVAIKPIAPFVMESNASVEGFSIELWKEIADDLNISYKFVMKQSVEALIESVKSGESDLAIAAVSINAQRSQYVNFSHQYFRSGLQIAIKKEKSGLALLYEGIKKVIFSHTFLYAMVLLTIMLIIVSHIVWIEERGKNEQFSSSYLAGIFDAIYWSFITMTTVGYGDKVTKTKLGKVTTIIWVMVGYFLFAYFTASVTTASTVTKLQGSIRKLSDLEGKKVAVVKGSTSEAFMLHQNIYTLAADTLEDACELLENDRVEAIVYDAPSLQYIIKNKPNLVVVDNIFKEEYYGIVFPKKSPYKEQIDMTLLQIMESYRYKQLYHKWFKKMDLTNDNID